MLKSVLKLVKNKVCLTFFDRTECIIPGTVLSVHMNTIFIFRIRFPFCPVDILKKNDLLTIILNFSCND